jgi:hypothetical protein
VGSPNAAAVFSHEIASGELLAGKNPDATERRERSVNQAVQESSSMLVCVAKFAGPGEVRESLELEKRLEIVAKPINRIPTARAKELAFPILSFLDAADAASSPSTSLVVLRGRSDLDSAAAAEPNFAEGLHAL